MHPDVAALTSHGGPYVIKLFDTKTWQFMGYLTAFDPDMRDPARNNLVTGFVDSSPDPRKALRFATPGFAWALRNMVSKVSPKREYGDRGPNRPLSAFTIQIITFNEAMAGYKMQH